MGEQKMRQLSGARSGYDHRMAHSSMSRDGRTALFIVVGAVAAALTLMIGLVGLSGWLVDSGDSEIGQSQSD